MWRHSTDINKNAGNNTSWNSNVDCKVTSTQLRRDPIKIKVVDSGKVIGEGSELKCDLTNNGQPAGAILLKARFKADNQKDDRPPKLKVAAGDTAAGVSGAQQEKEQIKAVLFSNISFVKYLW